MKKIVLKLYEFDELPKDSQEKIIERERWNVMEQCMDAYGWGGCWNIKTSNYITRRNKHGKRC